MSIDRERALLVFQLAGQAGAFLLGDVDRLAPMARLAQPPGLPLPLLGILNMAGTVVPVLRLDHLLQLPERPPGLYSTLILLKSVSAGTTAVLVDRVTEIASVPESALLPVGQGDTFNACAQAAVILGDRVVHVLSPERILDEKERELLAEFQTLAQQRLREWESWKQ